MLPQSPRTSCAPLIFLGSDLRSQISCVRIDAWPCQAHSSAFEALWAAQTTQVCRFFALLGYHISPASSAASTRVESMSPPLHSPSLSLVASSSVSVARACPNAIVRLALHTAFTGMFHSQCVYISISPTSIQPTGSSVSISSALSGLCVS